MTTFTEANLPLVIQLLADATSVGKSFTASRIRYLLDQAGIPSVLVRIETRGVQAALREGDVAIAVEDFVQASQRPGGIAGVLQPLSTTILAAERTRRVVIVDWAGGLARHHMVYLASTGLDTVLAEHGITALSFAVTTNRTEQMRQAGDILRQIGAIAPRMQRGLILNERFGPFAFLEGSQPAQVHRDLLQAARGCALITVPAVVGDSWKTAEDARMTMPQVIGSTPEQFAAKTGLDPLTARACITEVAAFWELSQKALSRVLRFRAAARAQDQREARRAARGAAGAAAQA